MTRSYADAYNNRGVVYKEKGDLDKAIADYSEAIELNPRYAEAYSNRGDAYEKKGDRSKADKDRAIAEKLDPAEEEGPAKQ